MIESRISCVIYKTFCPENSGLLFVMHAFDMCSIFSFLCAILLCPSTNLVLLKWFLGEWGRADREEADSKIIYWILANYSTSLWLNLRLQTLSWITLPKRAWWGWAVGLIERPRRRCCTRHEYRSLRGKDDQLHEWCRWCRQHLSGTR